MTMNSNAIIHVASCYYGGIKTVIDALSEIQVKKGYSVYVCCPDKIKRITTNNCEIILNKEIYFRGKYLLLGVNIKSVLNLTKRHNELVYGIHYHGLSAIGIFNNTSKPSICTIHGISAFSRPDLLTRFCIKAIMRKKNITFCAVDSVTSSYFGLISGRKVQVIPNGLPDLLNYSPRIIQNPNKIKVCFVGNNDNLKGSRYLFDAALECIKSGYNMRFYFAGDGDPNYLNSMIKITQDLDLGGLIRWLGPIENAGNILIPDVDIVVLPSKTEGLPMVLIEALRAGKTILATRVGGIPDLLIDNENGFFIKRDSGNIASLLIKLYNNPSLVNQFGRKSREIFIKKYLINSISLRYEQLYLSHK